MGARREDGGWDQGPRGERCRYGQILGVFESRADRRPRRQLLAQAAGVAGVTTCQPGERRAERAQSASGLEYVRSESIQGEILSQQLIFQPGFRKEVHSEV